MPWGTNGITVKRQLLDQPIAVASWAQSQVRTQTAALRTSGYLRWLRLTLDSTAFTATLGGGTLAAQTNLQLSVFRAIARFQLALQGVALIYDLRGEDLFFLNYVRSGYGRRQRFTDYNQLASNAASNGGAASGNWGNRLTLDGSSNPTLTMGIDIPIVEVVRFRDVAIPGPNGSMMIMDKEMEVGYITLQNNRSNVQPILTLNPLTAVASTNAPVLATGAAVASGAANFRLQSDIYDTPLSDADQPPAVSRSFVITRQNVQQTLSSGAGTYLIRSAGLLARLILLFYDASDNLIDVATLPAATANVRWGSSVDKDNETVHENLHRASERYGPPPAGGVFFDWLADDGSLTDVPDTAVLQDLRVELSGFTGATVVRGIEQRLVRVLPQ